MKKKFKYSLYLSLGTLLVFAAAGIVHGDAKTGKSLGIYIYENIEGYHTVSSTAGAELSGSFLPFFEKVMAFDKVPLQSNETVRILEKMTKDRKFTLTAISTWLSGGVISAPSITFADDEIKFKDLTWHVDKEKVVQNAKEQKMTHVLIGSYTGLVKPVKNKAAQSGGRLSSVSVVANLNLIDISTSTAVWAKHYRETKAGFDYRTDFDDLVLYISQKAGKEAAEALSK